MECILEEDPRQVLKDAIYKQDRKAIKWLYQKYHKPLKHYIENWFHGRMKYLAEDLVHEVFLQVCMGNANYRDDTRAFEYLLGMARNISRQLYLKYSRHNAHHKRMHVNYHSHNHHPYHMLSQQERDIYHKQFQKAMDMALEHIHPDNRRVFQLTIIKERPMIDVSKEIVCPISTLCRRRQRAIRDLKVLLMPFEE
jgi:RNA polymerase sigma factor (sigma-70 family)